MSELTDGAWINHRGHVSEVGKRGGSHRLMSELPQVGPLEKIPMIRHAVWSMSGFGREMLPHFLLLNDQGIKNAWASVCKRADIADKTRLRMTDPKRETWLDES